MTKDGQNMNWDTALFTAHNVGASAAEIRDIVAAIERWCDLARVNPLIDIGSISDSSELHLDLACKGARVVSFHVMISAVQDEVEKLIHCSNTLGQYLAAKKERTNA